MSLEWQVQMSVGNDLIDSDHKYLIELINQIEESLGSMNRGQLAESLDGLSRYSLTHFARRRKLPAAGYPDVSRLHGSHEVIGNWNSLGRNSAATDDCRHSTLHCIVAGLAD
jgi:hemerythrin